MKFNLGELPFNVIAEEGIVPLAKTNPDDSLVLLTDGNATDARHQMYAVIAGQTVELRPLDEVSGPIVSAYLFVIRELRKLLQEQGQTLSPAKLFGANMIISYKISELLKKHHPEVL